MDEILLADYIETIINSLLTTGVGAILAWMGLRLKDYRKKRNKLEKILISNTLLTCKAIIYSDNDKISLNEKLKAYQIYREMGGNGETHLYVKEKLLHGQEPDDYIKNMNN